jgi:hypothetical protein
MRTASECFQQAAKCKAMASAATDEINRTLLLEMAEHWLKLARNTRPAGLPVGGCALSYPSGASSARSGDPRKGKEGRGVPSRRCLKKW